MSKLLLGTIQHDAIVVAGRLSISFHRTLRIPDDGETYPLPPGLGRFPLRAARDYASNLPREWLDDYFLPIYSREALWIGFDGVAWKPNAVKVAAGGVNVITGVCWDEHLLTEPQDYIVCPDQPWIDGINSDAGAIRQFVAMRLGGGYTIEGQVKGAERIGGLQFVVFDPKEGLFPNRPPARTEGPSSVLSSAAAEPILGVAVGGRMQQRIYTDRFGIDAWDLENHLSFRVHFVSPSEFSAVTAEPLPPTPVDAHAYTDAGLPWFELYEEQGVDLTPAAALQRLRSIRSIEKREPEPSIRIPRSQVGRVRRKQ